MGKVVLVKEVSFWLNGLHASVKNAAEEQITQVIRAIGIVQKVLGIPSNLSGTFCGD